jgi:ABC-type amino acid transport system permease subunit
MFNGEAMSKIVQQYRRFMNKKAKRVLIIVSAALIYWVICLVIERGVSKLEKRVRRYEGGTAR